MVLDPFGNYLCQKLLEHCDDQKRLVIVQNVADELVSISLNMHGTRAVQKMIEYLTTPEQIKIATAALNSNAVLLIKDLNGNHVIQKCLNRLSNLESQFIFDAVSEHCIEVATHRHGCCVLQRCIDHASSEQKSQIITQINRHAQLLVQVNNTFLLGSLVADKSGSIRKLCGAIRVGPWRRTIFRSTHQVLPWQCVPFFSTKIQLKCD